MDIKPEKFLCAFNSQGWGRFDAKKLEEYAKRNLDKFKPQDTQENTCEDCHQTNKHVFHTLQLIDWKLEEYEKEFADLFHLDRKDVDEDFQELVIIQCSNCGNWRVVI